MDNYIKICKDMRKDILKMTFATGNTGAHIGGSLSMVEIMAVLYLYKMNFNSKNMKEETRDRFILSKGHGAMAQYVALKQLGILCDDDLLTFKKNGTSLSAHPSMNREYGIEFSSGSLGQGLSLGVGSALALKMKNNDAKIYVLLGDGECGEGSVWEAAASASHYKLNNLVAIIDKNNLQYDGKTTDILSMEIMEDKWKSFGWMVADIDGHNIDELKRSLDLKSDKPLVIIANTVKGKGVSFIENNAIWHNRRLTQSEFDKAIMEQE